MAEKSQEIRQIWDFTKVTNDLIKPLLLASMRVGQPERARDINEKLSGLFSSIDEFKYSFPTSILYPKLDECASSFVTKKRRGLSFPEYVLEKEQAPKLADELEKVVAYFDLLKSHFEEAIAELRKVPDAQKSPSEES